ncbi:MAG: peptidylprolyl isomerase [Nitrospiraceae bacterium]|nr:MAG: peptidylprolyl isomerase [Nitrospiraceae bacterium]
MAHTRNCLILILILPVLVTIESIVHGAVLLDRVAATVNNEVITWSELVETIMMDGRNILDNTAAEERKKKIKELERPFLEELVNLRLQLQEARTMQLSVGESEIDSSIDEIKSKYNLTEDSLNASLKAEGLTMKGYRDRLRDQILLQKTVNFAVRNKIVITDRQIQEYFEKNRGLYSEKESLKIKQIFFKNPDDRNSRSELVARAEDILQGIRSGSDFSDLARQYSEGPESEFGGDLGYITLGSALKEIEDAALALRIGEVSKPFWSPAGLHIIRLEDKKEGGTVEKVREQIKDVLFQEAFQSAYSQWRADLREKAYVEIKL